MLVSLPRLLIHLQVGLGVTEIDYSIVVDYSIFFVSFLGN